MTGFVLIGLPGIIALSVVGVLVVAGIVVFLLVFHKKKYHITYEKLNTAYETYHTQLTSDCQSMIQRLQILGMSNNYFHSCYEERQKQYDELLSRRDRDVALSLHALQEMMENKEYKDYRETETECQEGLSALGKAVGNFSSELTAILQEDNDIHSDSVPVKAKYRQLKAFYEEHNSELKPLADSFEKVMRKAEETFADFESNANKADFNSAKANMQELDTLLSAVLEVMDQLPMLQASIGTVLPEKLDKVQQEYHEMIAQGYVIQYMMIDENVAQMKERLVKAQAQLQYLDIRGVKEEIDDIQSLITDDFAAFEEEKKAKQNFLSKQSALAESTYTLEKRFAGLLNSLPRFESTFVLDKKYVNQIKALQSTIESIGYLKHELGSYLDTSEKKPYVVVNQKMDTLNTQMNQAITIMDDYEAYLKSLNEDSTAVYNGLRDCYVQLKEAQHTVREIDVTKYTNSLKVTFDEMYKNLASIFNMVITTPIDVKKAKELYEPFKIKVNGLCDSVKEKKAECEKAEASIVYANAFRYDYADCRIQLQEAENAFSEYDFARAQRVALKVIETFSVSEGNK